MSIWCSHPHIGTDPTVMYDLGEQAKGREPVEQKPERGNVISYAEGFSNHYPDLTGSHERPACIGLATIAPWCVPGHEDAMDGAGPWLRLEVAAPETLNFWTGSDSPTVEAHDATVILDRAAAEALRDDLDRWLAMDHHEPREGA